MKARRLARDLHVKPHISRIANDAATVSWRDSEITEAAPRYAGWTLIIVRSWRFILASQLKITFRKYFRSSSWSATRRSSPSTIDAVPSTHGPVTRPRTVQGATRTRGLLRMRLTFHESLRVYAYSASPCRTNQTGVLTPSPFFLNVSSEMYVWLPTCANVDAGTPDGRYDFAAGTNAICA